MVLTILGLSLCSPLQAGPPKFVEVARSAGIWRTGIGWGLSWADIDGDGDLDLLDPCHDIADPFLFLNRGDGTFADISKRIPSRQYADHHIWRWADFNNDGYPDLTNGVGSTGGHSFNYFETFLNDGKGRFEDLTDLVKLGDMKTRGRAVTWFDADGDGLLDALLTAHLPLKMEAKYEGFRGTQFYRNRGNMVFHDHTDASGIGHNGHSYWCAPGDFDGDGDIDLFIQHHGEFPHFFENLGNLKFRDITKSQPFAKLDHIYDVDWVDYDSDGDLDLYISQGGSGRNTVSEGFLVRGNEITFYFKRDGEKDNADEIVIRTDANRLDLRNCEEFHEVIFGRRIFRPTAEQYLIGRDAKPATALPLEINRHRDLRNAEELSAPAAEPTGAPGIYVWRAMDEPAWHIRFVRGPERQGREYCARVIFSSAIDSAAIVDGELIGRSNYLYENQSGRFIDVTARAGLADEENTGDALWQDFDNDGDIDLLMARMSYSFRGSAPLVLYDNFGSGRFKPVDKGLGLERGVIQSRAGVTCADYDNDGYLDLAIGSGLSYPPDRFGESMLFRSLGGQNHWLKLRLKGTKSNADAIGAWVTLETNGKKQTRYHIAGQAFDGQDTPLVHFGLGKADKAEKIQIRWPDGQKQTLTNTPADQTILVVEK